VTRPFLATITHHQDPDHPHHGDRVGCDYIPDHAQLRADLHTTNSGTAEAWPVELTRCGQHPGTYNPARNTPRQILEPAGQR
jgi:hypothetical protein